MAASLKTQKPEARARMAWCRPPAMFTPCRAGPAQTRSAASTLPPAISADASNIRGKTGLSGESKPCPTPHGSSGARRTTSR